MTRNLFSREWVPRCIVLANDVTIRQIRVRRLDWHWQTRPMASLEVMFLFGDIILPEDFLDGWDAIFQIQNLGLLS